MQGILIALRFDVGKIGGVQAQHPVDSNGRDQCRNAGRPDLRQREGAYRLRAPPIVPGKRKHDHDAEDLPGDRPVTDGERSDQQRTGVDEIQIAADVEAERAIPGEQSRILQRQIG